MDIHQASFPLCNCPKCGVILHANPMKINVYNIYLPGECSNCGAEVSPKDIYMEKQNQQTIH